MLAQIRNFFRGRRAKLALLLCVAACFASCATKQDTQLVSDPTAVRGESTLPWNQQEKWESSGQFGALADQLNGTRR